MRAYIAAVPAFLVCAVLAALLSFGAYVTTRLRRRSGVLAPARVKAPSMSNIDTTIFYQRAGTA